MQKRYQIFKDFQKYIQKKDNRSMDDICANQTTGFYLQAQQQFLREYIQKYPDWKSLLLYHEIGSGKTCTAITMAQEYRNMHPKNKVKVILPARLRTNFIDELISPCGMDAYISNDDFILFHSPDSSAALKKRIKAHFMKNISEHYELLSFEKLKKAAFLHRERLDEWAREFTKDSMIIVDEVHNMLSDKHDRKKTDVILKNGGIKNGDRSPKGLNTIIFKFITKYAHPSSKMIFLTATPIFDNIQQLKELAIAMKPDLVINKNTTVMDVIQAMRGKVSYFPGTSKNAYPSVSYTEHRIPMSKTQQSNIVKIIENGEDDEKNSVSEAFFAKQRQIGLACLPNNAKVRPSQYEQIIANMKEYSPKILSLMNELTKAPKGKHLVYSNFVQAGLYVVEAALRKQGWVGLLDVINDQEKWNQHKYKVYAIWDGSISDANKQLIKAVANAKNNIFGDKVRVILGSPSIKEGISFKHIQHMHILDPVWNQSAILQVEGRAIRYCSHVDINEEEHAPLKRSVVVHKYMSVENPNNEWHDPSVMACDTFIYETVIPKKQILVNAAEYALRKVAIDYYLFRNIYGKNEKLDPLSPLNKDIDSPLNDDDDEDWVEQLKWNRYVNMKTKITCPKARRPDRSGNCPANMVARLNKQEELCCYKTRKAKDTRAKPRA